jgi:hypothetical protein
VTPDKITIKLGGGSYVISRLTFGQVQRMSELVFEGQVDAYRFLLIAAENAEPPLRHLENVRFEVEECAKAVQDLMHFSGLKSLNYFKLAERRSEAERI